MQTEKLIEFDNLKPCWCFNCGEVESHNKVCPECGAEVKVIKIKYKKI